MQHRSEEDEAESRVANAREQSVLVEERGEEFVHAVLISQDV